MNDAQQNTLLNNIEFHHVTRPDCKEIYRKMGKAIKYVAIVAVLFVGVLLVPVLCGKLTTVDRDDVTTTTNRPSVVITDSVEQQKNQDGFVRKKDLPSSQWKSLKRSKYLTYLFRKYGSGGSITFEVCTH